VLRAFGRKAALSTKQMLKRAQVKDRWVTCIIKESEGCNQEKSMCERFYLIAGDGTSVCPGRANNQGGKGTKKGSCNPPRKSGLQVHGQKCGGQRLNGKGRGQTGRGDNLFTTGERGYLRTKPDLNDKAEREIVVRTTAEG